MVQLELLRKGIDCSKFVEEEKRVSVDELTMCSDNCLYKQYYTDKALFDAGSVASKEMVLPDKKPFPMN